MAARKTIKSFTSKTEKAEPIPFELNGENFEAYGAVSGAALLKFIKATSSDDTGATAGAILDYLKSSMDSENYKRFDKVINDADTIVEMETLSSIVSFLIEERTSRPTEAS